MKRIIAILLLTACASACASLPLKQQATVGLQASEAALEAAHDLERGFCFNAPTTESGGHCTNPSAAVIGLTDARHQKLAGLFSAAFEVQGKAATAMIAWRAGDPAPTTLAQYQADIAAVLAEVQLLAPKASALVAKAQEAVTSGAAVLAAAGVK